MATIRPVKNGYRVQVYLSPKNRPSSTFQTKRECIKWANQQMKLARTPFHKVTLAAAMRRYLEEISPKKKGRRWDEIRIAAFLRDEPQLSAMYVSEISRTHIADWRNRRQASGVIDSTVRREWTLCSSIFNACIQEWEWLTENPMRLVKLPTAPPPQERIITDKEIELLNYVTDYGPESNFATVTQRVGAALHVALETAMRAQEICLLRWEDLSGRVAKVRTSKTRSGIRQVPLSRAAVEIIDRMRTVNGSKETVFELTTARLDALFRKAKKTAGLEGFTFHDSRATAITRLAKKLEILDLAKMIGHKNLSMLMVYYREGAEELAAKLD